MRHKIQVLAILSLLAAITLLSGISISPAKAIPIQPWRVYGMAYIDNQPAGTGHTVSAKSDDGTVYATCPTTVSTTQNYTLRIPAKSYDPPVTGAIDTETIHLFIDTTEVDTVRYKMPNDDPQLRDLNKYTTAFSVSLSTPTNLASNSVTLNATLNGLGSNGSVNLTFEYGLTTSYGTTVTATPPSRTLAGSFSANITGLTASNTYFYKAVATGVTSASASGSFTTTAPTLTVITGSASGITTNSATLSGTLADMGGNSTVNVSFVYGTSATPTTPTPNQLMNGPGGFSYILPGLTAGTTYYFQAKATGGSTTAGSDVVSFRTTSASGGCTTMCCHRFWGTAYSTSGAVANASIVAYANGIQKQTATANSNGVYNMQVPISGGNMVTFTVNGAPAAESTTGQCMGVNYDSQQPFDLHASVAPGPAIGVSPASLSFTAATNASPTPASQNLYITNTGSGTLVWTASKTSTATWLTIGSTGGTAPSTMAVSVSLAGLSNNTVYSGTISIAATGAGNSPVSVPVTLTIGSPPNVPTIGLSATSFAFTATSPGSSPSPASSTLTISNAGSGTLAWTATKTASWLTIGSTSGTAPSTMTISVSPSGLADNTTYTDTITIVATGATNTPQTVTVTLRIGNITSGCLGSLDGTAAGGAGQNAWWLCRFQASCNTTVSKVNINAYRTGNIKVAIYNDYSGAIGNLLCANNTAQPISATGPASLSLSTTTNIISGKWYWLSFIADANVVGISSTGSGTTLYSDMLISSFSSFTFPPSGPGMGYPGTYKILVSGSY